MRDSILEVRGVTKVYKIYKNSIDRLKEIFLKKRYHKEFIANRDITFELSRGETLGIIGMNGTGKSTILKIIAGVIEPTAGEVIRRGRVTALLELGTGFNPEMSGYENIYLNGTLIGMSRGEIDSKIDDIIEFSELGEYIYEPIVTYSSGMSMRLAFSIAIFSNPEILIVDEALSVGDAHFSAKCTRVLRDRKEQNMSIIYVSHDLNSLKILCDRVLLLNRGEVIDEGEPDRVISNYNFLISKVNDSGDRVITADNGSFGTMDIQILDVSVRGVESKSNLISSGERAEVNIKIESKKDLSNMTIGIIVRDRFGQDIFGTNSKHHNLEFSFHEGYSYICKFDMDMNIGVGKYSLTTAIHSSFDHLEECVHWVDNACEFEIAGVKGNLFIGICRLEPRIELRRV